MTNYIDGIGYRDLYNMAAVTTGAAINRADESEELKQIAVGGGIFLGLPYALKLGKLAIWDTPKFAIQNFGNYGPALQNVWANSIGKTNLYSANKAALKGNFWNTVNHSATAQQVGALGLNTQSISELKKEAKILKEQAKSLKKSSKATGFEALGKNIERNRNNRAIINNATAQYKAKVYEQFNIPKLLEEAKGLKGKELAAKMKEIEVAKTNANIVINDAKAAGKIQRATKVGRAASWVKTKTGIRTAQNAINKGALSANTAVRTLSKSVKAGGAMAAISMACEVPTISEGFKMDKKTGWKQLGHSSVKVAAETAGWIAGAKVGGIAGAKLGATIGTCIGGPIGTAIGGAVGTIVGVGCGLLCSWLAGKGVKKILGKDPVEKAKENNAKQLANAARDDKNAQLALAQAAAEKIENGEVLSEKDANSAIKSINKVANGLESAEMQTASAGFGASPLYYDELSASAPMAQHIDTSALDSLMGFNYNNMGTSTLDFNPFMSAYSGTMNPFMPSLSGSTNPFMSAYTGTMNPFMTNMTNTLNNPFMMNPYMLNQNFLGYAA